jgi:hypothetical protein
MPWNNLPAIDRKLTEALNSFDWGTASVAVGEVVTGMRTDPDPIPLVTVNRMLRRLRRKRQFAPIEQLAEEIIASGRASGEVRCHYAQALIDDGRLPRAEQELRAILESSSSLPKVLSEAQGLIGRVYKQRYVDAARAGLGPSAADLQKSSAAYWEKYDQNRSDNYWHGINVVALLARAARDGVPAPGYPPVRELASRILASIELVEEDSELNAWQIATAMEAHVALQDVEQAALRALEYASSFDADAFEIFSTKRQLREVWGLSESGDPMGERLLPILDAALLRRQGGTIKITTVEANRRLEENYGSDRFNTVAWYQDGLDRCRSIGRVVSVGGTGKGTGWLVNSRDFFPAESDRPLLLTNAHVINKNAYRNALHPEDAKVQFQMSSVTFNVGREVWSCPELDATFVELDGTVPNAIPLPLYSRKLRMTVPPSRVYIIGHPGDELTFSLQDSHMVRCTDELLHYRTPTQGGSSGSPVFEAMGWRVVALHHAALDSISANEGILIARLRERTLTSSRSASAVAPP